MKKSIWLLFLLPLISFTKEQEPKEETYYYFCTSRPIKKDVPSGTGFYTDIKQVCGDQAYMKLISRAWYNYLKTKCKNQSGCTSDLNYYTTMEHAQAEYQSIVVKRYKPYKLEKVLFNFEPGFE